MSQDDRDRIADAALMDKMYAHAIHHRAKLRQPVYRLLLAAPIERAAPVFDELVVANCMPGVAGEIVQGVTGADEPKVVLTFARMISLDLPHFHEAQEGDSVLGPRRIPHAFVYDGAGPGRILIGFTPAGSMERFFRDLEKRGEYFGNGSAQDKETARQLYGIVNVGPPLKL